MSSYLLVQISRSQRSLFISAWETAFSRVLESSVYDWIFDERNIIYALVVDREIVAGYCLYPFWGVINRHVERVLLCNNVFVDPKHQGRQLFVKIGKLSLAEAAKKNEGILAYGIPNALALPGHKRVGWDVRSPIAFLESSRSCANNPIGDNWIHGKLNEKIRSDIEKCSKLSSVNRDFSILKTAEFVAWRYENKPKTKYWFGLKYSKQELLAYCVCKYFADDKVLHFIDVDGVDALAISQLVDESQCIPEDFLKLNIWESTMHAKIFHSKGYEKTDRINNLILIDPKKMASFELGGDINIVLGDNDVF